MQNFKSLKKIALVALVALSLNSCLEKDSYVIYNINFQNLYLSPESYWNGSDGSGSVVINSAGFYNFYEENEWGEYWEGFAFSNITDNETMGYSNQYSAYVDGEEYPYNNYAVAYINSESATIFFSYDVLPLSISVTNSTWAYLSMLNGDTFAKQFEEGDWFLLTIKGYNTNDQEVGVVEFYLADMRSPSNFIVKDWTTINLSPLGEVSRLVLHLSSSDTGDWGMNTPAYVCIDNFVVKFPF